MPVKCLPSLLNEKVDKSGLTYEWILRKLDENDKNFGGCVGDGEVTKVGSLKAIIFCLKN